VECPSCAAENPTSNTYCGRCGDQLSGGEPSVPHYASSRSLVKREIVIVAAGITAVLAAAWCAWYLMVAARSPSAVVSEFMELDRKGRYAQQENLVASSWDNRMALSLFQQMRQQSGSSPFQNSRIVRASETRSQNAFVDVELSLTPPSLPFLGSLQKQSPGQPSTMKMNVTFVLVREGDGWKIESSQTLASVIAALMARGFQQFSMPPGTPNIMLPPGWPTLGFPPPSTSPSIPPSTSPSTGGTIF
jgi:hypothetical protein